MSMKSKAIAPQSGGRVGDNRHPAGSPPPVRGVKQNTPSPAPEGGKYVGDVGDNPRRQSNTGTVDTGR